jgi:hypothetical protein
MQWRPRNVEGLQRNDTGNEKPVQERGHVDYSRQCHWGGAARALCHHLLRIPDIELQDLMSALLGFSLVLVQSVLSMSHSSLWERECLDISNFIFDSTGPHS